VDHALEWQLAGARHHGAAGIGSRT
jgi:hypothetical protein